MTFGGIAKAIGTVACVLCLGSEAEATPVYLFTTPDSARPTEAGDGLNGEIWTDVDVDSLSAARGYIAANAADATFTASSVDYPNGLAGMVKTDSTVASALGVDAATLSDLSVGDTAVLNSILRFSGYLLVESAGSLFLGVSSDDGSELIIQGTQAYDNGGLHWFLGGRTDPVEVAFSEAGLYEIEILFFESNVEEWGVEFFEGSPLSGMSVPQARLYTSIAPIPIPASLPLLGGALLGLATLVRRRRHDGTG